MSPGEKPTSSSLQQILSRVPVFSFLEPSELAAVGSLFVESTNQKGEYICHEGDQGDTFYIILEGELEVVVGKDDEARVVGILKKGDFFGEMALLQGGQRSASVIVTRRTQLLTLERTSFSSLFLQNPKALEHFTRVLCKRVAEADKRGVIRTSTLAISVSATRPELRGKSMVARALAAVLFDLTQSQVLIVRFVSDASSGNGGADVNAPAVQCIAPGLYALEVRISRGLPSVSYAEIGSDLVSRFSDRFPILVFDINKDLGQVTGAIELFSDVLVEIVDTAARTVPVSARTSAVNKMRRFQVVNRFNPGSPSLPICHCEPFVLPRDSWLNGRDAIGLVREQPRSKLSLPIHRLARKIVGATVGVALGGGAAFGIAHLGVLNALEKHGIPIDLLAGCSQGAIIAAGYAAGVSTKRMIEIALELGSWRNSLRAIDLTFTRPGLLEGSRFATMFEDYLGDVRSFSELSLPCMAVATDVESGERVAIGSGPLSTAFRASAAVPMVFSPVKVGDNVLVDGGVSDPVPAEVVNQMGADLCIAVNVVPSPRKGVENAVSRAVRIVNSFNPMSYLQSQTDMPNMFDVIMNAMQILQHELGNFKAISADVLIKPDLSDFTWIDYNRAEELIRRGEEAAERAIPAIERTLRQKLEPSRSRASVS
jgi:NTE family protein